MSINLKRVAELAKESRSDTSPRPRVDQRQLSRMTLREQFLWAAAVIDQAITLEEMVGDWPLVAKILSRHMKRYRKNPKHAEYDFRKIQRIGPKLYLLFQACPQETRDKIEVRGMMAFLMECQDRLYGGEQLTSSGDSP